MKPVEATSKMLMKQRDMLLEEGLKRYIPNSLTYCETLDRISVSYHPDNAIMVTFDQRELFRVILINEGTTFNWVLQLPLEENYES